MKTPKEFTNNLKQGILTDSMLEQVLYSYNKRAKNCRNKERELREKRRNNRYWNDLYDSEESYEEKKEMYYQKKSDILLYSQNHLKEIHKVIRVKKIRIEDRDEEYCDYTEDIRLYEKHKKSRVVNKNEYYDRDTNDYITFIDVFVNVPEYYLFYEFPNYSFHQPIEDEDLSNYKFLETKELDELETYGKDINELLSCQFCDKVWSFIVNQQKECMTSQFESGLLLRSYLK